MAPRTPLQYDVRLTRRSSGEDAATLIRRMIFDGELTPKWKAVLRAMTPLLPGEFFALVPDAQDVWRRGFGRVLKAFRRGDAEATAHEFARTMHDIGEKVVAVFQERGLFEPAGSAA